MLIEPVEMEAIGPTELRWPRRMIEPLPNCFSIWPTAMSMALLRSFWSSKGGMQAPLVRLRAARLGGTGCDEWIVRCGGDRGGHSRGRSLGRAARKSSENV